MATLQPMKRFGNVALPLFLCTAFLTLTGCVSQKEIYQPNQNTSSMTPALAQWQLFASLVRSEGFTGASEITTKTIENVSVTPHSFRLFESGGEVLTYRFRELNPQDLSVTALEGHRHFVIGHPDRWTVVAVWPDEAEAKRCADALAVLVSRVKTLSAYNEEFRDKAKAWRALSTTPPLPEEVIQQNSLAEQAFRAKKFEEAITHYETALAIDPLWPQGQYNAALLCEALEDYPDAIEHGRCYLELVPDSPEAVHVKGKISIWQGELNR